MCDEFDVIMRYRKRWIWDELDTTSDEADLTECPCYKDLVEGLGSFGISGTGRMWGPLCKEKEGVGDNLNSR